MYLLEYVNKVKSISFAEKPFDYFDALVLAACSFSNLDIIGPSVFDDKSKPGYFKDISDLDIPGMIAGTYFERDNDKLIALMRDGTRYQDIGVKYICKTRNPDFVTQFWACTFEVPTVGHVIGYRGTDSSVIGWRENILSTVYKAIPSQLDALDYLNIIASKVDGPLYIVGDSKGGNLALYSAIKAPSEIKRRIIQVYDFEGFGLNDSNFLTSSQYLEIKDRISFFCPEDAYIGIIKYNPENKIVVKTKGCGISQHYPFLWKINDETMQFEQVDDLSFKAHVRQRTLNRGFEVLTVYDIKLTLDFLTKVFGGNARNVNSFLKSKRRLRKFLQIKNTFSLSERSSLRKSLFTIIKIYRQEKKAYKKELKLAKKR